MFKSSLRDILRERVLVLDGSMGVSFQKLRLSEDQMRGERFAGHPIALSGNFDIVNLTSPEVVEDIHRGFLQAGADIIETNTFNSQALSQREYGCEEFIREMNVAGARIARKIADEFTANTPDKPRFVAGSVGPSRYTLSLSTDVSNRAARAVVFDEMRDAYLEQIEGLIEGGVDLILVETIFDTLSAKAVVAAYRSACCNLHKEVPLILSITLSDSSGRLLNGQTPEGFLTSLSYASPLAIGFNCSGGPDRLIPFARRMNELSPFYSILYPNAGCPNELGEYAQTPEIFNSTLRPLLEEGGVNIIGGCCGTTPEHIRKLAELAARVKPRIPSTATEQAWLAGLDAFSDRQGFINVGERCNVAGSRKFLRLINEKRYDEAVEVAVKQVRQGAMMLDINLDDGLLNGEEEMRMLLRLLNAEPETASVPWMIDSSSFEVIRTALKEIGGKAIVNSISLKHGDEKFLEQAREIRSFGAAVVVMLFDEAGQAVKYEDKIRIAKRAYDLLLADGWNPRDIVIDPNILTIATGIEEHNSYAIDFIRAVKWIKENLPGVKTSGGVSNLSFAFRGNNYLRQAMHAVFLYHAIQAGLDMAIVDPTSKVAYSQIDSELLEAIEDAILNRKKDSAARLIELAAKYVDQKPGETENIVSKSDMTVTERLVDALINGNNSTLVADLEESVKEHNGDAAAVVEGPLMAGMDKVGHLFESGKMFLPQVVKSARTMRQAVDFLQPLMERNALKGTSKGLFLIATVKGDVHDIGKNIAAVVLRCNNYAVEDLGVQVEASTIVEAAKRLKPDFIGLSGLITPSLHEMALTVRALREAGIETPVMVGGAATSELHTALKIAPESGSGVVVRVSDAAKNGVVASRLQSDYEETSREIVERYSHLIADYETKSKAIPEGDFKRFEIDWSSEQLMPPAFKGMKNIEGIKVRDVAPFINWRYFLHCWRTLPSTPQAEELLADAQQLLESLMDQDMQARVGIFEAYGEDESVVIGGERIATPRQARKAGRKELYSLADFVAPCGYGDYAGVFAISIGEGLRSLLVQAESSGDDYAKLLLQSICDRLTEACSEFVHQRLRREIWGYAPDENLSPEEVIKGGVVGIRPAIGYGSIPDQSQMHNLNHLLDFSKIGVKVTENGALWPSSSTAGIYLASPKAIYFNV